MFLIPKAVTYIITTLENSGHEAYMVGGCVRDAVCGKTPHDYDLCTSASPDEIIAAFPNDRILITGIKHGTVAILIDGETYEVTTYRIDGEYSDNRRPDSVSFTKNIKEDLARRDFTINAMAYNPKVGLYDPFDGMDDIKNKCIRCVGAPEKRFTEDALRILRAWRFNCQTGFEIEKNTLIAAQNTIDLLKNISAERIRCEFIKAFENTDNFISSVRKYPFFLTSVIPEWKATNLDQNNPYHDFTVSEHILKSLSHSYNNSDDLITRLAVFFHDIGKPFSYQDDDDGLRHFKEHAKVGSQMCQEILTRLKFDNYTIKNVSELVHYHDGVTIAETKYIKRRLNKLGEDNFRRLLKVQLADVMGQKLNYDADRVENILKAEKLIDDVINSSECFSIKALAVNGSDLIAMGYESNPKLGETLKSLLNSVIDGKLENTREALLTAAKKSLKNQA